MKTTDIDALERLHRARFNDKWQADRYIDAACESLPALIAELRRLREENRRLKCKRCNGTGVVQVRHGTSYETDSAEERALCWQNEKCPDCAALEPQP